MVFVVKVFEVIQYFVLGVSCRYVRNVVASKVD